MTTVEVHTMRRIIFSLAGAAVLAGCGAAGATGTTSPTSSDAPAAAGATLSTMSTSLGVVLTNPQGFTLYYFLPEKNSTIGACTGGCLTAWPPLVATGTPSGPPALTGTLGTVSVMVNGSTENEVTYNGWPLHTYASDTAPGQTNGQGIGGNWFAITPATTATATGTSSTTSTPAAPPATPTASTPGGYGY
jgi:predicted lipoprotein with Yx(FWY)xxD motif